MKEIITKYSKEIRFLITGGSSTILDFIVYMLLSIKMNIAISKFLSMTVSSIYSFFINKNWTFSNNDKISVILVIKYLFCVTINIAINTTTNSVVFSITNNKIVSFVIATCVAMIVNYIIQKYVVFRGGKK